MSHDHKPVNKEEAARITAAGGFVEYGRVNGNLALSRAVGDFEFKQNFSLDAEHQAVTVNPDVIVHEWTGEEEFLVVACDGIWDCLSSQQVVDFTRRAIANGDSLTKIAEDMMEKCLAPDSELGGVGCDNMTVVVVALLHGKTEDEWRSWVKQRVEDNVGYTTPESVPDVFKTPPVYNRAATTPTANGVPATGSGSTAGARKQGGSSLAELLQGGGLGGVDLKQLLAGTGINLSAGGLLSGQGEDDEEDEDDEDEDEVRFFRSIGLTLRTQTNIVRPFAASLPRRPSRLPPVTRITLLRRRRRPRSRTRAMPRWTARRRPTARPRPRCRPTSRALVPYRKFELLAFPGAPEGDGLNHSGRKALGSSRSGGT